jgi:hypothetical protein
MVSNSEYPDDFIWEDITRVMNLIPQEDMVSNSEYPDVVISEDITWVMDLTPQEDMVSHITICRCCHIRG